MKSIHHYIVAFLLLMPASIAASAFGAASLVEGIIANPTIVREQHLPHLPLSARQVEFLIENPRIAVALAHHYAPFLDPYRVELRPDRMIHIEDSGKLAGDAELAEAGPGRRVYLIAGSFDIFKIRFHGHMVLATAYSEHEAAPTSTDATTTAYIKVKSSFAGIFARMIDRLFPKKVDERIERFVNAAKSIAAAVHKNPKDAYRKLRASGMSPDELKEFGRIFLK